MFVPFSTLAKSNEYSPVLSGLTTVNVIVLSINSAVILAFSPFIVVSITCLLNKFSVGVITFWPSSLTNLNWIRST